MSRLISLAIREKIAKEHEAGVSYRSLSKKYKVSYNSVRTYCRAYQSNGVAGLIPKYANCGRKKIRYSSFIYRCCCWLKYLHPNWGATYILVVLKKRYGSTYEYPCSRTLQKWFKSRGLGIRKVKSTFPASTVIRAKAVHEIWQVDAKEKVKLGNDSYVCWLTIVDELSGALLSAPVFFLPSNIYGK